MVAKMPRKKRTIVEETIPDAQESPDNLFAANIITFSKVYKLNSGGKAFCFQSNEPVDEVSIQEMYPTGGKFVVHEFNDTGEQMGTRHIDIEPRPITAASNNHNNTDDIRTRMLLEELSFTRSMMLKMIEGMMTGKSQTPIGELAAAMESLNNISSKSNPIDLLVKGMEIGTKAGGGASDWKAELVSAAKDVIPAVVTTMGAARQTQGQPTMIAATPASMMKQGIDWLKPQILAGMSADLAIGWVIQNAKDPLCNQLIAHALKGDVNTFIAIDAELANEPYRTWFESAISLLKEEYAAAQQQTTDDDDSNGRTGNSANITGNANVSTDKPKVVKVG